MTIVCAFDDLAVDSATRFVVDGRPVAVVRIGDDVYAIGDICSHADVSLSEGEVFCEDKQIECYMHGSLFSLETGEPLTLPATQPVPVYVAKVIDGNVDIMLEAPATGEVGERQSEAEAASTSGEPQANPSNSESSANSRVGERQSEAEAASTSGEPQANPSNGEFQ